MKRLATSTIAVLMLASATISQAKPQTPKFDGDTFFSTGNIKIKSKGDAIMVSSSGPLKFQTDSAVRLHVLKDGTAELRTKSGHYLLPHNAMITSSHSITVDGVGKAEAKG